MRLTPHFSVSEFRCSSGEGVPAEYLGNVTRLCARLEIVRAGCGEHPVKVTSGYRSPEWNAKVRGAKRSHHLTASAADIRIYPLSAQFVYDTVLALIGAGDLEDSGVGLYLPRAGRRDGWVHLDTGRPRRWRG